MVQAAARQSAAGEITTLLGRGATFEGKLTFDGTVRIDGRFKGEVFTEDTLVPNTNEVYIAEGTTMPVSPKEKYWASVEYTMPDSEMTAMSVVPPPMSTTMLP